MTRQYFNNLSLPMVRNGFEGGKKRLRTPTTSAFGLIIFSRGRRSGGRRIGGVDGAQGLCEAFEGKGTPRGEPCLGQLLAEAVQEVPQLESVRNLHKNANKTQMVAIGNLRIIK